MSSFSRKHFLKLAALTAMVGKTPFENWEATAPNLNNLALVHLLMEGGPDFRHVIVPEPSTDYGKAFWKNRAISQGISSTSAAEWQNKFTQDFVRVQGTNGNPSFGIHRRCGWLATQYNAGKVAIVANVKHSESRDHQRALLVLQKGNYSTAAFTSGGSGWGGRLIGGSGLALNSNQKILSLTGQVRPFCNGNPANIVSFRNSRQFGLFTPDSLSNSDNSPSIASRIVMHRAQKSYYERVGALAGSTFEPFKNHYDRLRSLTDSVRSRVSSSALPAGISGLLQGSNALSNRDFASQIRSAHDAFLCRDLLGLRILSMNFGGFDTHRRQRVELEQRMEDIFGTGKGLDQLFLSRTNDFNSSVIVANGEFGRQLRANGDNSTDHGDANYMLFIGGRVNGGTYGELFPSREIPLYERFWEGIQSRNNFRAVFQSLVSAMGGNTTDVFNMTLTSGEDFETGFGSFSSIIS